MSVRLALVGFLLAFSNPAFAVADTNSARVEIPMTTDAVSSNDTLRVFLQMQEQLHATQLAVERTRHDAEDASARNAEMLAAQLRAMEQKLSSQRIGETRLMVYVLTAFAGLSFMAVVVAAYFQWRTVKRLADLAASLPLGGSFAPANDRALAIGDNSSPGAVGQSSGRLLGAVERLERRILELEHAAAPALKNGSETEGGGSVSNGRVIEEAPASDEPLKFSAGADQPERISHLLEKGQTLLNEDKPEAAIEAFDLVLALDTDNTEALVKKGSALEKLRKLQEAIECYDRAIAVDSSMTIAYLHKGGLFNRMERFGEAVECYEKALRTQEKRSAA